MKDTKKYLSDKTVTNLLYVLAVVVIISVIIVTIAAFATQNRGKDSTVTTSTTSVKTTTTLTTTKRPPLGTEKPDRNEPTVPPVTDRPGSPDDPNTPDKGDEGVSGDPIQLTMPVKGQIGKHHETENLLFSMTMNDYRTHSGLDISAEEGSAVLAAEDGVISAVYSDYFMGQCVEIDHGNGIVTVYQNLSNELPEDIAEGAKVKQGDVIGAVGSTSIIEQAEESHIHFELRLEGESVDPLEYIDYTEETFGPSYEDEI